MHQSVRAAFRAFTEPFEGRVPYPYLDVKGLVTVGTGNLIDPSPAALGLPWQIDGRPATRAEILADWTALKKQQGLARLHHKYAAPVTRIRLTPEAMDALLLARLDANEADLKRRHFPDFDSYPADAQLALLSIAWAVGSDWPRKFPRTKLAVLARDWSMAATEGVINSAGNPGVIPRNHANRLCFQNAARVDGKSDHTVLHWPDQAQPKCPTCGRAY